MRESADTKARRMLVERRVNVVLASERGIWALVRGDSGLYHAKWTCRSGTLVGECDCAAPRPNCSHLLALRMVWDGCKTTEGEKR